MNKIVILIPCFNGEATIKKIVTDFKIFPPSGTIYAYDNNSTDKTTVIAKSVGAVARHDPLKGKGNVIRRMFAEIDAECYVLVDGDDTQNYSGF